jgi:hypothetical protein
VFYLFLLGVAAVGGIIYVFLIAGLVPGLKEERFGELEPLPPDLGVWRPDLDSFEARAAAERGEKREQRHLFHAPGLFGAGRLVLQVRYRDAASNAIVRVEPDQPIKRRRIRAGN